MRIYTVLTSRDPEALQRFAQTAFDCGATGVTVFTTPALVQPVPPAGQPTPDELQARADQAAARKDYQQAAALQAQVTTLQQTIEASRKQAADWIKNALALIKEKTQLVVLGGANWPQDKEFTPSNFLAQVDQISQALLTPPGIGGIVQQTPLAKRTFIPLAQVVAEQVAGGNRVQGEPATAASSAVGTPARHPSIPLTLNDKQAQFATYRLGLDRGGARRSKQEAGNMLGWSPVVGGKAEAEIGRLWPDFQNKINENVQEVMP